MTLFKSLRDLLATYLLLEDLDSGIVVGRQELTGNPQIQYTLVIYYSKYGTFYHESKVENEPSNNELIIENEQLFKALDLSNMEIRVEKDPEVIIESAYTTLKYRDLVDQLTEHFKEVEKVEKDYLIQ